MFDFILQSIPLWLTGVFLIVACLLAAQLGRLVRRRSGRDNSEEDKGAKEAEGYIIGAIFGLLAFIIGLTFSIALDRFDSRRSWVAEEATAINTAFLRASLFDEPARSRLQSTLRIYAHGRIAPEGVWDDRVDRRVALSRQLRHRLWDETQAAVLPVRETELASYFVDAMNEVLTAGTRRELAGNAHIPDRIIISLLLYLLVASAVLGYLAGEDAGRLRQSTTMLFALFALTIVTILDLDRPQSGYIRISQDALEDLVVRLDQSRLPAAEAAPVPATTARR